MAATMARWVINDHLIEKSCRNFCVLASYPAAAAAAAQGDPSAPPFVKLAAYFQMVYVLNVAPLVSRQ